VRVVRDGYEATAAVIRGDRRLPEELADLARWISVAYSTDVVNIVPDVIQHDRPRLGVWLRTGEQARAFRRAGDSNYDAAKQAAIAARAPRTAATYGITGELPEQPDGSGQVLVTFADFETEARNRAVDMPRTELDRLRIGLANDVVWAIMTAWGRVVFFVHTDDQVAELNGGSEFRRWTQEFMKAARRRDEFGVLDQAPPMMELDSKERYDRDFEGSSYYYFL
jgi:hypothetical protein